MESAGSGRSLTVLPGEACAHPRVLPCPSSPHGQETRCLGGTQSLVELQVNFYSTLSMENRAPGALSKPSAAQAERCQQPRLRGSGHGVYQSCSSSCPRSCGLARALQGTVLWARGSLPMDLILTKGWLAGKLGITVPGWTLMVPVRCLPALMADWCCLLFVPSLQRAAGHCGLVKAT